MITAMFPTATNPVFGIVVQRELARLRAHGTTVQLVTKTPGWRGYLKQGLHAFSAARKADVVHAHYGTSGFIAALTCWSKPLIMTLHGSDIALGARPRVSKYWLQYLLSVAGGCKAAVIIVQDANMSMRLPRWLRGRCVVMGQSVEPAPAGNTPQRRSGVLFLSDRARPVKRFPLAAAAVALLPRAEALDSLDHYPPAEIGQAMHLRRVGLLTSEREGMPVAVKEALAAGLRVVSVDLPALRDLAAELPLLMTLSRPDARSLATALASALEADATTDVDHDQVENVFRRRGWLEPDRTLRLQRIYADAAARRSSRSGDLAD